MKRKKPRKTGQTARSAHSTDTDAFVKNLRRQVLLQCDGMTGREVATELFRLTDEMWNAGIDDCWDAASMKERLKAGNIFCITWLTLLVTRLHKLSNGKSARKA